MNMDQVVKKLQAKSFSGKDIIDLTNHKTKIVTYPSLLKYDSIEELLYPHGCCVILYETRPSYGHWTCIIKHNRRGKESIEHFDSYGLMPDDELKFVPAKFRKVSNQDYQHLSYLLDKSGIQVEYNDKKLQRFLKDMNTCGRWVGMRIVLRFLTIDQFIDLFTGNVKSPDYLVTALTLYV